MPTYIYSVRDGGDRGYNQTVVVYRMRNNVPEYLGKNSKINTAVTYGPMGEAVRLVGKLCGHRHNNYRFDSPNIHLYQV
jgi:hypothetical protein